MKLATAHRYAVEIARRVREVNGLIPTPRGEQEFMRVKKMWIFGSTVKGSQNPNDLDLLIDWEEAGKWQRWDDVGFDPRALRSRGVYTPRSPRSEARIWLTKGMRNVSRHDRDGEASIFDVQVEIYPNFELKI